LSFLPTIGSWMTCFLLCLLEAEARIGGALVLRLALLLTCYAISRVQM
jgi:hypothetical protein